MTNVSTRFGRPPKITTKLTREICQTLERGSIIANACILNGVGRTTYYRWIGRGERDDLQERNTLYREFLIRAKASIVKYEMELLDIVRAGGPQWKAAAWLLEKRFPTRWSLQYRRRSGGSMWGE